MEVLLKYEDGKPIRKLMVERIDDQKIKAEVIGKLKKLGFRVIEDQWPEALVLRWPKKILPDN